jgi:hypothetical protein
MADSAPVEYEVIQGKARAIEKQLNELAAGGWQVIGVTSVGGGLSFAFIHGFGPEVTIVLRRERG